MQVLETLGAWIQDSGSLGYVLAPVFTVVVAILPVPAEIPAMLNGMVFGPLLGTLVTWWCSLMGAQISFELARRCGRPLGARMVSERLLARADDLVATAGWPVLLCLRLIPTVAFTGLNWASGFTAMRRRTFLWTTAVGIIPGAVLFTGAGSGLLALVSRSQYRIALYAALALLALASLVYSLVRRRPQTGGRRTTGGGSS